MQVETPRCVAQHALMRSSDTEMWPPAGEQLDQSGSNDFSAFKEIQELKEGSYMLRSESLLGDAAGPLPASARQLQCSPAAPLHVMCS